jgi:replicative DNA helicase
MAPSGVGKSIALCYTGASAVKQNKIVFHYTFELSSSMTAARYDSALTSIDINERHAKIDDIEKKINIIKDVNKNTELFIKEYSTGTCTSNMLRADIEKKIGIGYNPDLIIIDYLDIMAFEGSKSDDSYYSQQKISEELRAIAQDYRCCIITATQTNREGVNSADEIESDKIADSYGKVKTSDLIISINQSKTELLQNKARLYIAKNRSGHTKKIIPITIHYSTMSMKDRSNTEIMNEILDKK